MHSFWKKFTSRLFWHDRMILVSTIVWGLGLGVQVWLLLRLTRLGEFLPLHYTVYFGVDQVGQWYHLVLGTVLIALMGIVQLVLAVMTYHARRLYAYIMIMVAVFGMFLSTLHLLALMWYTS